MNDNLKNPLKIYSTTINCIVVYIGYFLVYQSSRATGSASRLVWESIVKPVVVLTASFLIAGCAAVQQAPTPDAADVHRFIPSERRLDVLPEMADPIVAGPDSIAVCLAVQRGFSDRYRVAPGAAAAADPSCRKPDNEFVPVTTSL